MGGGDNSNIIRTTDSGFTTTTPPPPTKTTAPATDKISVTAVPSKITVKPGETFDVFIRVVNDQQCRGVSFTLNWDTSKVTCNSGEPGAYLKDFASANNGDLFYLPSKNPDADNSAGQFPKTVGTQKMLQIVMTGAMTPNGIFVGPTGSGDIYVLHMTANSGVSGNVTFSLSNVILGDTSPDIPKDLNAKVNNGQITISP
ncbi:hypothetical protein DGWBC_0183 [Dehalogenimonas sp. WBC-2]|nr:hypothetical protein DGWBC_0183 [Dehalogenimonas sp. WBC-2]